MSGLETGRRDPAHRIVRARPQRDRVVVLGLVQALARERGIRARRPQASSLSKEATHHNPVHIGGSGYQSHEFKASEETSMRRAWVFRFSAVVGVLLVAATAIAPGCGSNDFLGLEDYQRDLLIGGLAAGLLLQADAVGDDPAPDPVDGRNGEDGLSCWDLDGDGVGDPAEDTDGDGDFTAADCVVLSVFDEPVDPTGEDGPPGLRCWDLDGDNVGDPDEDANGDGMFDTWDCQGPDGAAGSPGEDGSRGPTGPAGADGPEYFDIFIDDFFTVVGGPHGELPIQIVSIEEPLLGVRSQFTGTSGIAGYRVAIPDRYEQGNDVLMRLFFHRTGQYEEACFVFTVDGRRLRDGSDVELYGPTRWVRPDASEMGDGLSAGILGTFLVVDLPISTPAGLDYPNDLAGGDFLAFELNTYQLDGYAYHLLGVEFIESAAGSAALAGASVFMTEDAIECVYEDCNENGVPDFVDIRDETSYDCDQSGVPDECELDCNENGFHDSCDIADGTSLDCDENGIPDECAACPPLDLVFLMDTSGSMQDEGVSLCASIDDVVSDLALRGIVVHPEILAIAPHEAADLPPCVSGIADSVEARFDETVPGDNGVCPGTLTAGGNTEKDENWGTATAIVAERYPWTTGAIRVIVPVSDEGACLGDDCYDPGEDRDAVANAIVVANDNDVIVSPIAADGSSDCVVTLAQDLAAGTGGVFFESTDPGADLSGAITELVEEVCRLFSDCDQNGVPDECELVDNDCNANGVLDVCDILQGTSEDCQPNGIPDECDGGCLECAVDADCVDEDLCTIETCDQGACVSVPVECPPGYVCVEGECID
jgi:hypothetical protein